METIQLEQATQSDTQINEQYTVEYNQLPSMSTISIRLENSDDEDDGPEVQVNSHHAQLPAQSIESVSFAENEPSQANWETNDPAVLYCGTSYDSLPQTISEPVLDIQSTEQMITGAPEVVEVRNHCH